MFQKYITLLFICALTSGSIVASTHIPALGASFGQFASNGSGMIGLHSDLYDIRVGGSYSNTEITLDPTLSDTYTTSLTRFIVLVGAKDPLFNNTDFSYGFSYWKTFGEVNSIAISNSFTIGFYLGIQHKITDKLLIEGQLFPFTKSTTKYEDDTEVENNTFFSYTSIGLTLLIF